MAEFLALALYLIILVPLSCNVGDYADKMRRTPLPPLVADLLVVALLILWPLTVMFGGVLRWCDGKRWRA